MRYQFNSRGVRQNFNGNPISLPSGIKLLIIINIIVFILMELSGQKSILSQIFGLVPQAVLHEYKLWQACTYLFIHGGFIHILFNMLVLWMFGKDLEVDWSKNEFLIFYFTCGIGAGLVTVLTSMNSFVPIVGASGAIYGILVAYGFTYPNKMVYLYGIFPLKVKYMVLGLGIIAFFASLSTSQSSISHITHLSGMIIGVIYIVLKFRWGKINLWYIKKKLESINYKQNRFENDGNHMKIQVDKILDKVNNNGWESLTYQEKEFLTNASKRMFDNHSPN